MILGMVKTERTYDSPQEGIYYIDLGYIDSSGKFFQKREFFQSCELENFKEFLKVLEVVSYLSYAKEVDYPSVPEYRAYWGDLTPDLYHLNTGRKMLNHPRDPQTLDLCILDGYTPYYRDFTGQEWLIDVHFSQQELKDASLSRQAVRKGKQ